MKKKTFAAQVNESIRSRMGENIRSHIDEKIRRQMSETIRSQMNEIIHSQKSENIRRQTNECMNEPVKCFQSTRERQFSNQRGKFYLRANEIKLRGLSANAGNKLQVPPPDKSDDFLGLKVLDEPCAKQSDPTVLNMQLRATTKQSSAKTAGAHRNYEPTYHNTHRQTYETIVEEIKNHETIFSRRQCSGSVSPVAFPRFNIFRFSV